MKNKIHKLTAKKGMPITYPKSIKTLCGAKHTKSLSGIHNGFFMMDDQVTCKTCRKLMKKKQIT